MGFIAPEAYTKITNFRGDKNTLLISLETYFSETAKELQQNAIGNLLVTIEVRNGATMQEMYDALKLQEPFINSIDV